VRVYSYLRETDEEDKLAIAAPARRGQRRVIVATNVAETSLTIDGLRYVVDSGLVKQTEWDPELGVGRLRVVGHSQFGVQQRWGRVGRKAPGWVFPLYTEDQYKGNLPKCTPPEATRSNLESLYLNAKAAGVADLDDLRFISADDRVAGPQAETFAKERLRAQNALEERGAVVGGVLTALGREMQLSAENAAANAALAVADATCCAVEVATAVALLAERPIQDGLLRGDWSWSPTERLWAQRHHEALTLGCRDDLDAALRIFHAWELAEDPPSWAALHWVDQDILEKAMDRRNNLLAPLAAGVRRTKSNWRQLRLELGERARASLWVGLADLVIERQHGEWTDHLDVPLKLESNYQAIEAGRVLALHRVRLGDGILGTNLVGAPMSLPSAGDALEMTTAIASMEGALHQASDCETFAVWNARLETWPVGSVVSIGETSTSAAGESQVPVILGRVLRPPMGRPVMWSTREEASNVWAAQIRDAEDEVADDSNGERDDSDIDVGNDGEIRLVEPVEAVAEPESGFVPAPLARAGAQAFREVLRDGAHSDHSTNEEYVVLRHEEHAGAIVPVVDLSRSCHMARHESWRQANCVVTDVRSSLRETLVEVLEPDSDCRYVVPSSELSLYGHDRRAGNWIVPGNSLSLTFLPEPKNPKSGLVPSLRPALATHQQRLPRVDVFDSRRGVVISSYPATVVSTSRERVELELDGSDREHGLVQRVGVPKAWLSQRELATGIGSRVSVALRSGEPASVTTSVLPVGISTRLPRRSPITVDEANNEIKCGRVMSLTMRKELIDLASDNVDWAHTVKSLWLKAIPSKVMVTDPPVRVEVIGERLTPGTRLEGRVVRRRASEVVVAVADDLPLVRVDRSRIGGGLLDAAELLVDDQEVVIEVLRVAAGATGGVAVAGGMPELPVPTLTEQVAARFGGTTAIPARVVSVRDDSINVTLPGELKAKVPCRCLQLAPHAYHPGDTLEVDLSHVAFLEARQRPGTWWLSLSVRPHTPAPVAQVEVRRTRDRTLPAGTYQARVAVVEEHRIVVNFDSGFRRSVQWQKIGQHGLLFPDRFIRVSQLLSVEVGQPYERDGHWRNDLRITGINTDPLPDQIMREFGAQVLADRLITGSMTLERATLLFVEVWAQGGLCGAIKTSSPPPERLRVGNTTSVRVTAARVSKGKPEVNLQAV
jgi:hypothetical protein